MDKKSKLTSRFLLYRGTTEENDYLFDKRTMTFKLDQEMFHPIWFSDKKEIAVEYHESPGKVYTAEVKNMKLFDTKLDNDTLLGGISKNQEGKPVFVINKLIKKNILEPLNIENKVIFNCIVYLAGQRGTRPIQEAKEASVFDLMVFPDFLKLVIKKGFNCLVVNRQGLSADVLSNAYGVLDPKTIKVIKIEE